jgi:hypothetical protein
MPSNAGARLLPVEVSTRIRFLPNANFNGTVQLWYTAWDRSNGTAGGTLPLSGNQGGSKSLSMAMENAPLTILPVNDLPSLSLSGTIGYTLNAAPIVLAPGAVVSDVDSPDFSGGELRVSIGSGSDASNRLELSGLFTISKKKVLYAGIEIGTLTSNGIGTNALAITFNGRATLSVVQALIRSVTFRTTNGTYGANRLISFYVTDGDGGMSPIRMKTVSLGSTT